MLPFLVLLVAASALAAPGSIRLNLVSTNDPSGVGNSLIDRVLANFDAGDYNINILNYNAILKDVSRLGPSYNQALPNGHLVAVLGEIFAGRPGCACDAADFINKYTRYIATGNSQGVREALTKYVKIITDNIDNIVGLATNKESVKYKSGYNGSCSGEGRTFQLEAAWDIILGAAPQKLQKYVQEKYCVVKRLYCGVSAISNVVAATSTAIGLPPIVQVFEQSSGQLNDFLSSVAARGNLNQSAASLKQALSTAAARVTL